MLLCLWYKLVAVNLGDVTDPTPLYDLCHQIGASIL